MERGTQSKILIVCGAGVSATFLKIRLHTGLKARGYVASVNGVGQDMLDLAPEIPDIVLVSPVASDAVGDIRHAFPNAVVEVLPRSAVHTMGEGERDSLVDAALDAGVRAPSHKHDN